MSDANNMTYGRDRMNRHPGTISSSLLGAVKESNEDAWARMTLLYAPLVFFWCRRAGLQSSDAEDVVQEVLVTVASRVGEFERNRVTGSFRGWLRTITYHKLGDFMRVERHRERVFGDMGSLGSLLVTQNPTESENGVTSEETKLVFNRVLDLIRARFEESTWRAFLRVVMNGAPAGQVAEELGLSIDSVYQAKSRVLRKIRAELRELGE
jgi:RNA polymerase sigma-70 factor, ECF subfamily